MTNIKAKPFIIWTLQRTGGTNLAAQLMKRSEFPLSHHEPFNKDRCYGHITEEWKKHKDKKGLEKALAEICTQQVLIKHCVETVPLEITVALIQASINAGYKHIFLYRKNAADRLLSLHFAKNTGIWGTEIAKIKAITLPINAAKDTDIDKPETCQQPVPVTKLIDHEKNCIQRLNRVWDYIDKLGGKPIKVSYEDLYASNNKENSIKTVASILDYLEHKEQNDKTFNSWAKEVLTSGDQGTRNKYSSFPRAKELRKQVENLPGYVLGGASIKIDTLVQEHPWVVTNFIDIYPQVIDIDQTFMLGGVVVITSDAPENSKLVIRNNEHFILMDWNISSPWMKKKYPTEKNASQSRWRGKVSFTNEKDCLTLELVTAKGEKIILCKLNYFKPQKIK